MVRYTIKHVPEYDCFSVFRKRWLGPDTHIKGFYYPTTSTVVDMQEAKRNAQVYITHLEVMK